MDWHSSSDFRSASRISPSATLGIASCWRIALALLFPNLPIGTARSLQWADILCTDRPRLHRALLEAGIDARPFWFPLHRQEPYKANDWDFPVAIDISVRGLWLPSAFSLTRSQAEQVAQVIRDTMRTA